MPFDRLLCFAASILFLAPSGFPQSVPNLTDRSPLVFEPNQGQSSTGVSFLANHRSYRIRINESSLAYVIATPGAAQPRIITLRWEGAAVNAKLAPENLRPGISNYFLGQDRSRWVTKVLHYADLKETGVFPGVDLRYHSNSAGDLEYDVILAPQTDLASVKLSIEGADQVRLCEAGALCLKIGNKELRQMAPRAYEMREGKKVALQAAYVLKSGNVSFAVLGHLPAYQLVIDPVIQYATYMGGTGETWGQSVAVDPARNVYISGLTWAIDFPTTQGSYLPKCATGYCWRPSYIVAKFSPSGQLIYSTYLGMGGPDFETYSEGGWAGLHPLSGKLLAADSDGNAYVAGEVGWVATTAGAYQQTCPDDCAFLSKLNPDGSELLYSTYFGSSWTAADGIAIGQNGDIYMVGTTMDLTLPTTRGAYQTACQKANDGTCFNGFAARIDTSMSGPPSLMFSTYLGVATGLSRGRAIAVDQYGDAYVVGLTTADMPNIAVFGSGAGPQVIRWPNRNDFRAETFVIKLSGTDGWALRAPTLLRGVSGTAIAVDSMLNTLVAGSATNRMATTPGSFQTQFGGGDGTACKSLYYPFASAADGFVAKLDPSGRFLLFSTFLGGSSDDLVTDIAVNNVGKPFVIGTTCSTNFPMGSGAFKGTFKGWTNAFVAALNANGRSLNYSSYLGGGSSTSGSSIAIDPAGNAYITGQTFDSDFPVTAGAFQPVATGSGDAFVAKIVIAGDVRANMNPSITSVPRNGVVIYHARITNMGPDGSDKVVVSTWIPAGMSYVGVYVPNGDGCAEPQRGATSGALHCRKARLEKGQTYYVNVYLRAIGKSGASITNRVTATAKTQDLWLANNSATATVKIQ